jgi:SAM-dependent methyltransferase
MYSCPECRQPIDPAQRCACGFLARIDDGIVDLMTPAQIEEYSGFITAYDAVRQAEGWGGDDLDLPHAPQGHREIWAVRRRTFRRLDRLLRRTFPTGGKVLDAGAGNCWLTRHLDHWGFDATALDINTSPRDGLRAGQAYLSVGDRFERVRAPMEAPPFPDESFDLVVSSGAFHYAPDPGRTLGALARVLKSSGHIVILDSPWYERRPDGRRAWEQGVRDLIQTHGLDEADARRSTFLYPGGFEAATLENGLTYRRLSVWPGWRRAIDAVRGRFYERPIAAFPLLVVRKRS